MQIKLLINIILILCTIISLVFIFYKQGDYLNNTIILRFTISICFINNLSPFLFIDTYPFYTKIFSLIIMTITIFAIELRRNLAEYGNILIGFSILAGLATTINY